MKLVIFIRQLSKKEKSFMNSYEEWLKRARSSLELAKSSDNELVYYEDLCFQAQQATGKH